MTSCGLFQLWGGNICHSKDRACTHGREVKFIDQGWYLEVVGALRKDTSALTVITAQPQSLTKPGVKSPGHTGCSSHHPTWPGSLGSSGAHVESQASFQVLSAELGQIGLRCPPVNEHSCLRALFLREKKRT